MARLALALLLSAAISPAFTRSAYAHSASPHDRAIAPDDLFLFIMLGASAALYIAGYLRLREKAGPGPARARRALLFAGGWLACALALASPLERAAQGLFTAHMIEHMLLMSVAAPLLVLSRPAPVLLWGAPQWLRDGAIAGARTRAFRRLAGATADPFAMTALHAAAIWIWHLPALYDAALRNDAIHWLQHVCFFVTALLFWRALAIGGRAAAPVAAFCLFLTSMHTGGLGALLTFAPRVWYPSQGSLAEAWGLTPLEDQQLGGLVMWAPGGMMYMLAALLFLAFALYRRAAPAPS